MTVESPSPRDLARGSVVSNAGRTTDLVGAALEMPLGTDSDLGMVSDSLTAAHEMLQRRLADLSH